MGKLYNTKSWQVLVKFDKSMKSYSQILENVKICPEMAMLCKVTASNAQFWPNNANISPLMVKLYNFMIRYGKYGKAM